MKITIFALCFMCATAAFGQMSAVSNEAQPLAMVDHPRFASQQPLRTEMNLLGPSGFTYDKGERPLWEFPSAKINIVPLGDIARDLRKEHLTAKKADKILHD
jgi:hypothetical protein